MLMQEALQKNNNCFVVKKKPKTIFTWEEQKKL